MLPEWIAPMLASPDRGRLPEGAGWHYEHKLDGYRTCACVGEDGSVALISRLGNDFTHEFPDAAAGVREAATRCFGGRPAVLDAELAVLVDGRADFSALQERRGQFVRRTARRGAADRPPGELVVVVFDVLWLAGAPLLDRSYVDRRAVLADLLPGPVGGAAGTALVQVSRSVSHADLAAAGSSPTGLLAEAGALGFEGLIAKAGASRYHPGRRTDEWRKHPLIVTQEVLVCGWRPGTGTNDKTFGGLLLGAHDPDTGALRYLGDVGTGFTQRVRGDLHARLAPLRRADPPFDHPLEPGEGRGVHWVAPVLVGEVQCRPMRGTPRLRHASWRGLRPDRQPDEIRTAAPVAPTPPTSAPVADERVTVAVGGRRLRLTNLGKPLYPTGFSKAEVIRYYTAVAPLLLPHLTGRPVTFIRYPNGVQADAFYGKNIPAGAPDWLRTTTITGSGSRSTGEPVTYPLLDDLPALVWAANLAALELHVPQWTIADAASPSGRGLPNRLVFDLDPGPGSTVVECAAVADRIRAALTADGLTPVASTSGGKGLQVYAGIRTDDPRRPSGYAKALATALSRETPDLVTATMTADRRHGRVLVDWSQNNPAKTTISPYSLRGRDRPTAATPVTWAEVRDCRRPADLTFTAPDTLDRTAEHGDLLTALHTAVPLP